MRYTTAFVGVFLLTIPALADHTLSTLDWNETQGHGTSLPGQVVASEHSDFAHALKVTNAGNKSATLEVWTIEKPAIAARIYAVTGMVRCQNVQEGSYLEMWSYFPNGSHYFSRTLANEGPMERLDGTQSWRQFALPFDLADSSQRPIKLTVSVVLVGRGEVFLGPLELKEYPQPTSASTERKDAAGWWSDRAAGVIGAVGGLIIGIFGTVIGVLIQRGRAMRVVLAVLKGALVLGLLILVLALAALLTAQPFNVWLPSMLLGLVLVVLPLVGIACARRRYREVELRRIAAMDTGPGRE